MNATKATTDTAKPAEDAEESSPAETETDWLPTGCARSRKANGEANSLSTITQTETGWSQACLAHPQEAAGAAGGTSAGAPAPAPLRASTRDKHLRLVFDGKASPLVSSRRKATYRARYVDDGDETVNNTAGAIPIVAVFFNDRRAFEKEFEKLELAGRAGVGPRIFDVCHRKKPQVEACKSNAENMSINRVGCASHTAGVSAAQASNETASDASSASDANDLGAISGCGTPEAHDERSATFPCLIEEDLGVSLADMIGKNAAAPHVEGTGDGIRLAPIGSAERAQQAAKIAFDIGTELAALHAQGAFYLDLKPSNVCVRAYGSGPADIRAGLIDFESLVASNRPSDYSTLSCYGALCAYARSKGIATPMLTNMIVDLGFLVLMTACMLCGKAAGALNVADIDAACALPGMGFFAIRYGCFDVRPLSENDLIALAEAAGMAKVCEREQAQSRHAEAAAPERAASKLPGRIAANAPSVTVSNPVRANDSKPAPEHFDFQNAADGQPAFGRFGFYDAVDELRAAQNPLYVLAKRKFDIALACHADWRGAADQTRSDLIDDFFAQDPVKIKQGLRQADGILSYIARLGYTLVPEQLVDLPRYRGRRVHQLNCGQVLLIAQWEHESWRALHEQLGFHYAERNADGTRPDRTNEYLLPWAELCAMPETSSAPLPAGADATRNSAPLHADTGAACDSPATPASPSNGGALARTSHNNELAKPPHTRTRNDNELAKLLRTRARNDIAFACGIIDKLQAIGLAVISEAYRPPSR